MIKTMFKWSAVATALFAVFVISVVYARGVPQPPAIRTDGIGGVGWAPLFDNLSWLDRFRSTRLVTWMPDGSGYLVTAPRFRLDPRTHLVRALGDRPQFLSQIPREMGEFLADEGRDYLITRSDVGGDEQFRLFRWDLGDAPPVPITPAGERAHLGAFEPDGPRFAYTSNRRNGTDFDVYVIDPLDPASDRRVLELEGSWSVAAWSPDGTRLLLTLAASNTENGLYFLEIETGSLAPATTPGGLYVSPRWSRDGRFLLYGSNRGTEFVHLRRLDLETGRAAGVETTPEKSAETSAEAGVETILSGDVQWDVSSIQESTSGGRLLVEFNEGGRAAYYWTDLHGSPLEPFGPTPSGRMSASLHPSEPLLLIDHLDARGIGRVYQYDLQSGSLRLLAGDRPREGEVPAPRLVHYPTFDLDGDETRQIPAFVYPGVGPGPHPVTISVHGGPEAQAVLSNTWGATQKRGVTVITPNVRGSTGYGRTYEQLDNGVLREDAVRDIGALLDWVEEQPDLDQDRVAIVGGSYGGYMVLASLVHYGDRLRCGVDRVGISNFVTFLENTADYRRDLRRAEYGDERVPEMREFLESISPLTNANRIRSRLMVVQGANDPRVPVTEALQLVEKVRANGEAVSYMEAADEGHGFKKPWNALYAFLAEQEMLTDCLGLQ